VLVVLAHDRRRVVHTAVTAHPTAAWTAQQFREAFPWDQAPRYLIRDRDCAFQAVKATVETMGIEEVLTAPRSPWQNPYAERYIGSVRRECLDHVFFSGNAQGTARRQTSDEGHGRPELQPFYRRNRAWRGDGPMNRSRAQSRTP
jgi:hypothetical protein